MLQPDHVTYSLKNPASRRLILVDEDGGNLHAAIDLPPIGPQMTLWQGRLFDCWGREIPFAPAVQEVCESLGVGSPSPTIDRFRNTEIFVIKEFGDTYALANVTYLYQRGVGYDPRNFPPEVKPCSPQLVPTNTRFTEYFPDFFKNSDLGAEFAALGLSVYLFHCYGTHTYSLIQKPYRSLPHHFINTGNRYTSSPHTNLISPELDKDGDLIATIIYTSGKVGSADQQHLRVSLSAADVATFRTINSANARLSLPLRVLSERPG